MRVELTYSTIKIICAIILSALLQVTINTEVKSQETVFTLMRSKNKKAEEYYADKNYKEALRLYLQKDKGHKNCIDCASRIARCNYFLFRYEEAIRWFNKYLTASGKLTSDDQLLYAEALAATKRYDLAITAYKNYLKDGDEDPLILKKIWQLKNIQNLMEDSVHYSVKPIAINTSNAELCAAPYQNGIVFLSNRKEVSVVERLDAATMTSFYKLYYAGVSIDTSSRVLNRSYANPTSFTNGLHIRFNAGPVSFYDKEKRMVYSASAEHGENKMLGLYFAEWQGDQWSKTVAFPFNSTDYSISEPSISEDGNTLFFSSDMQGGFGEKDLYRSVKINGQWSKPQNLGDQINTAWNESFPFLYNNTLYFSSNGHAGFGGLDIFKVEIDEMDFPEIKNLGFPVNSNVDDFGITLDASGTTGYLTSNRRSGNVNDDLYELQLDLQRYPVLISGLLKYKEVTWADSSALPALPEAQLFLIDHVRGIVVQQTFSDADGSFSLNVPYFSQYKIRVVEKNGHESIVSLDMGKHKKLDTKHEIVVVRNLYASIEE